jgi:hypothetical protein
MLWVDLGMAMRAYEAFDVVPPLMLLLDVDVSVRAVYG